MYSKREFKEETGLKLINPKLQGISIWKQESKHKEGLIFIFTARDFQGELVKSLEGSLSWIDCRSLHDIPQFEQNLLFSIVYLEMNYLKVNSSLMKLENYSNILFKQFDLITIVKHIN